MHQVGREQVNFSAPTILSRSLHFSRKFKAMQWQIQKWKSNFLKISNWKKKKMISAKKWFTCLTHKHFPLSVLSLSLMLSLIISFCWNNTHSNWCYNAGFSITHITSRTTSQAFSITWCIGERCERANPSKVVTFCSRLLVVILLTANKLICQLNWLKYLLKCWKFVCGKLLRFIMGWGHLTKVNFVISLLWVEVIWLW